MKIYLAGKIYLLSNDTGGDFSKAVMEWRPYILESFYYADKDTERLIPYFGDFMLDSGAFTFMGGFNFRDNSNGVDFWEYAERYSDFVVRNNVCTILCNGTENLLFYVIAFLGVFGWNDILSMSLTATAIEVIIALCDTPFLYWAKK